MTDGPHGAVESRGWEPGAWASPTEQTTRLSSWAAATPTWPAIAHRWLLHRAEMPADGQGPRASGGRSPQPPERALRPSLGGPGAPACPLQPFGLRSRHGTVLRPQVTVRGTSHGRPGKAPRSVRGRRAPTGSRSHRSAPPAAGPRGALRATATRDPPPLSSLLQHRGARPGVTGGDVCPHRHSPRDKQPRPASGPLGHNPPCYTPLCVSVPDCEKSRGWDQMTWLRILVLPNLVTSLGTKWSSVSRSDPSVPARKGGG